MPEMVLPGVYIDVRAEGLIAPGRVTVGNVGIVGTAAKGPVGQAVLLSGLDDARSIFGQYDPWIDGKSKELTLVRALELAYSAGATTVFAVRVEAAVAKAAAATYKLASDTAGTDAADLQAVSPGTWGNQIEINVWDAEEDAFIDDETFNAAPVTLKRKPSKSGRNRISIDVAASGSVKQLEIVYSPAVSAPGKVQVDEATGKLGLDPADAMAAGDILHASYTVAKANSAKVTLRYGSASEVYTVADGDHLKWFLNDPDNPSALAKATASTNKLPAKSSSFNSFAKFGTGANTHGTDGVDAKDTDYEAALNLLFGEPVHIVVAAGQDNETIADELKKHCDKASTDIMKADRISVVGSKLNATFDNISGHTVASDRVIFVAPGFKATDPASGKPVTLPGSYTAAVIAGMLSGIDPHISLTNKSVPVGELEWKFSQPQLTQLVLARVLAIEEQRGRGVRVVKGITTDDGPFTQITTRRIVDYAKYGVRASAEPYIGRLNNERVRGAMKTTITSFLQDMLDAEMLTKFEVDVFATRQDEIKGVANVTIVLQPTFSIDFIKVTMFLS